jgi:hypothetical protein
MTARRQPSPPTRFPTRYTVRSGRRSGEVGRSKSQSLKLIDGRWLVWLASDWCRLSAPAGQECSRSSRAMDRRAWAADPPWRSNATARRSDSQPVDQRYRPTEPTLVVRGQPCGATYGHRRTVCSSDWLFRRGFRVQC